MDKFKKALRIKLLAPTSWLPETFAAQKCESDYKARSFTEAKIFNADGQSGKEFSGFCPRGGVSAGYGRSGLPSEGCSEP